MAMIPLCDADRPALPTAADQLARFCRDRRVSMRALSLSIGRGEKLVADIVNGRNRNPDHTVLRALAAKTGLAFAELAAERGVAASQRRCLYLDAVIRAVESADLPEVRRADIVADVKRVCWVWLDRDPATIPADPVALRTTFAAWTGARFGVSDKTLSNVLSNVRRALEIAGTVAVQRKPIHSLSPAWRSLWDAIPTVTVRDKRTGRTTSTKAWFAPVLSPFVRYCDATGIAPDTVTEQTFVDFQDCRERHSLTDRVAAKAREARYAWNQAVREVPGWPAVTIPVPRTRENLNLPLSAFPESFRSDLVAYRNNCGLRGHAEEASKPLLERARARRGAKDPGEKRRKLLEPLAPRTIKEHVDTILLAASAMVRLGTMAPEEFRSLADVADVGVAAEVVERDIEVRLGTHTQYAGNVVKVLGSVARRWVDGITAAELDDFAKLRAEVEDGLDKDSMSEEDRTRLAQFHDPEAMARLVSLPAGIIEAAEERRRRKLLITVEMALDVEAAVMCLIEQTLPVRLSTLARTDITLNLDLPSRRGAPGLLSYRADQTKTRKAIQAELAPWKVELLRLHLRHYRPLLTTDNANPHLFPGARPGTHKTLGAVSRRCCAFVRDWLGCTINMHLWRKLMGGYLLLQTRNMELVETLLGHSRGSRATKVYVEMQTRWAAAELDTHVTRLIDQSTPSTLRPKRRGWF